MRGLIAFELTTAERFALGDFMVAVGRGLMLQGDRRLDDLEWIRAVFGAPQARKHKPLADTLRTKPLNRRASTVLMRREAAEYWWRALWDWGVSDQNDFEQSLSLTLLRIAARILQALHVRPGRPSSTRRFDPKAALSHYESLGPNRALGRALETTANKFAVSAPAMSRALKAIRAKRDARLDRHRRGVSTVADTLLSE